MDFRPLNKNCLRENEHVISPFRQARLIPAAVFKTKTDAWNGYQWLRVIRYLDLVARNGIVLSPEKFEFCAHQIDFAGFRVTDTEVKPLPKYLDVITSFPRPTNISDISSWFGLVNQVSSYNKLTELMEPFRKFLSPRVKFQWDDEMDEVFERSKRAIVEAIVEGVAIFDPERRTAISTDYSTTGLGYFMYQKYCDCVSTVTTCCPTGWRVTLAGSRFLHQAERNYWPTEGETVSYTHLTLPTICSV